jgi:protein PhnA
MADQLPACPSCSEDYTYLSGALLTCPMCGHDISAKVPGEGVMCLKSSVAKKA